MTFFHRLGTYSVLAATVAGCGVATSSPLGNPFGGSLKASNGGAAWGMYNYFAMDNDLDRGPGAIHSLANVKAPNVVVSNLWDGDSQGDTQLVFQSTPGSRFQTLDKGEYDTGTAKALEKFVSEAIQVSPAKGRVLTMADHGGGIVRGICSDWNGPGGKKIIHVNEVAAVLSRYPVDILNFDACFMNMVEVAYEVRQGARYITGAQTTTYANQFSYPLALDAMEKNSASGQKMAIAYTEVGHKTSSKSHAYSTVDTAKTENVVAATRGLAKAMSKKMSTHKDQMVQAINRSQAYGKFTDPRLSLYNNYRDLGDIADNFAKLGDAELATTAKAVRTAIEGAVLIERHTSNGWEEPAMERVSGMMVYAPTDGSVDQGYLQKAFSTESGWGDVLVKLNSRSGWGNPVQKDKFPHAFPSRTK